MLCWSLYHSQLFIGVVSNSSASSTSPNSCTSPRSPVSALCVAQGREPVLCVKAEVGTLVVSPQPAVPSAPIRSSMGERWGLDHASPWALRWIHPHSVHWACNTGTYHELSGKNLCHMTMMMCIICECHGHFYTSYSHFIIFIHILDHIIYNPFQSGDRTRGLLAARWEITTVPLCRDIL